MTGAWESRNLFFLRDALIGIAAQWAELFPETPCPIAFSSEKTELRSKEDGNVIGVALMLLIFRDHEVLHADGRVEPDDYEVVFETSHKAKDNIIKLAKDVEERELFQNLWPHQTSGTV